MVTVHSYFVIKQTTPCSARIIRSSWAKRQTGRETTRLARGPVATASEKAPGIPALFPLGIFIRIV